MTNLSHTLAVNGIEKQDFPDIFFFDGIEKYRYVLSDSWHSGVEKNDAIKIIQDNGSIAIDCLFSEERGDFFKVMVTPTSGNDYLISYKENYIYLVSRSQDIESARADIKMFRAMFPLA